MLNVAYIGFGKSVCRYHLPYVADRDHVNVKYIYRREEDRIGDEEREKEYPDVIFTTDLQTILEDPEVNLVVINAPDQFHAPYTRMLLEAGKNVLCEKPFALTSTEARELFDLARGKGLIVMSNQNRRFDGDFLTVKKVIESGKLGDIVELESHYDYFRPDFEREDYLYNLTIHPIDQILALFGMPEHIVYDVRSIRNPGRCDDYNDIDFFYPGGLKATVKSSNFVKIDAPRFTVHGTKGSFIIPPAGHGMGKSLGKAEKADFSTPPEELWGTISYIDETGDHTEKVVREVTDYGCIYDNLDAVINQGAEKAAADEEVVRVLEIVEEGTKKAHQV